jgi:simple sugar transport system ATP-binding protein
LNAVTMALLDIKSLSLSFGSTKALQNASLQAEAGEIVALMGANGAGKSTLVKVLSGVHQSDSGTITFKGRVYSPATPADATRAGITTVHQSTGLVGIAGMTVADALLLNQFVDGTVGFFLSRKSVIRSAQKILNEIGFSLPLERDFADLSGAERQMVAIARALVNKAELLILDEPTASLSRQESLQLYDLLKTLKARGIAILYISHRTADLEALADRIAILRGGKVEAELAQPIDFDRAIEIMIGRPLATARPQSREISGNINLSLQGIELVAGAVPFDLDLCEGEVIAITGVLGAGKSRLLNVIFGQHGFAGGQMQLEGRGYQPRSAAEAIAAGVVLAGEDRHRSSLIPANWPGEGIAETISLPHLHKWFGTGFTNRSVETEKANEAISSLGIKTAGPNASVWSLSGGNQQKVVLGRWDIEPAKVLLLDEPFQGVDVGARQDIIAAIRSRKDRATLIATSDPQEAYEVADRVLIMDHHSLISPLSEKRTHA